jgi:hypothetical protein
MSKSNVQVFNAVVATAFDTMSDIHVCGLFLTEKDAVMAVIKKVFENDLISRDRYLELLEDSDEPEEEMEKTKNMTEKKFEKMVYDEVEENPTIDNLESVLDCYSDYDTQAWSFRITIHNL